jgi:hypothetical protein
MGSEHDKYAEQVLAWAGTGNPKDVGEVVAKMRDRITALEEAVRVLAEETSAWRAWERSCSAMAVQVLNKQDSPELNETADRQWIEAGSFRVNATNANPIAAEAVRKAGG